MLGRDETNGETTTAKTTTTTTAKTRLTSPSGLLSTPKPLPYRSYATPAPSWPSVDWIIETLEKLRASRTGEDEAYDEDAAYAYDDDDDDDDEIEEIDDGSAVPSQQQQPPPPPPVPHMSRYRFTRIDGGRADEDGRVNGTYVAVVENNRSPRVLYEPVSCYLHTCSTFAMAFGRALRPIWASHLLNVSFFTTL